MSHVTSSIHRVLPDSIKVKVSRFDTFVTVDLCGHDESGDSFEFSAFVKIDGSLGDDVVNALCVAISDVDVNDSRK